MVLLSFAFVLYAAVDAAAGYQRQVSLDRSAIDPPTLLSEQLLIWAHVIYHSAAIYYLQVACTSSDGLAGQRIAFVCATMIATGATTLVSEVIVVAAGLGADSLVRIFAVDLVFGTFAAVTLFLFRSSMGKEYKTLTSADAEEVLSDGEPIVEAEKNEEEAEVEADN
jgi:hypothetical protein